MDFEQLSAQHSNMIHSIINSLHIYKDRDEFYQVGLIGLWDASKNFDEKKGSFFTYAYGFIRGRMLIHLNREKKLEDRYVPVLEEDWLQVGYEEHFLEKENLLSHFYNLTDKEKQWVILRFYEGCSNKEIAEKGNLKLTSVRSCERRAMGKFLA